MSARVVAALCLLLVAPGGVRAMEAAKAGFGLVPGARFALFFERERHLRIEKTWLPEAASRMEVEWRVEGPEDEGLRMRWTVRRIRPARRSAQADDLASELVRMREGLELLYAGDREGRPRALLNREQVRRFLADALRRTLERLRERLLAQGYPRPAVEEVLARIERRFEHIHRRDDAAFDRLQLENVRLVTDLLGLPLTGPERRHREPRPVPWRERQLLMRIEDSAAPDEDVPGVVVVTRRETPLEVLSTNEILPRFPSLLASLARMPDEARAKVLNRLPDPDFVRTTRARVDRRTGVPLLLERTEIVQLGSLKRRTRTVVRIDIAAE